MRVRALTAIPQEGAAVLPHLKGKKSDVERLMKVEPEM